MKAITLWQPWASLVAIGAKKIETRGWPTKYRGPLAIHAGVKPWHLTLMQGNPSLQDAVIRAFGGEPNHAKGSAQGGNFDLRYGAVIAIADLVDCIEMTSENIAQVYPHEREFGYYEPGRFMWILANVRRIDPVPATGRQGLWNWEGL